MIAEVAFWTCGGLVAYAYAGYPIVLPSLARRFGKDRAGPPCSRGELPTMSLLIAAHNEEAEIEGRLLDALAMDYPREKLEIAVASDGSTDRTAAIVRRFADRGVRLFDDPRRRGKAAVIAATMPELRGEIVLLSDANTRLGVDAAARLARWFRDPVVGVACARLVLTDPVSGKNADGIYWKYENRIKAAEASLGALLGANGAAYAIRRDLFPRVPDGTIVDDFVIPLAARLASGCSIAFDERAIAREETAPDVGAEFRRRCRIGAGDWQSLATLWPLLDPRRGWIALAFLSHKVLRWLGPFLLIAMLLAGLRLVGPRPEYGPALAAMAGLGLSGLAALALPSRAPRFLRLPGLFVLMNLALLVGFFRWATGRAVGTWTPTVRPGRGRRAEDAHGIPADHLEMAESPAPGSRMSYGE
jgi:cellulose synthase/poly-beta-1,6-N-acetylglucosamine synthase-like glycosyltransferase